MNSFCVGKVISDILLIGIVFILFGGCRMVKWIRFIFVFDFSRLCQVCFLVCGLFEISSICSWFCMFWIWIVVVLLWLVSFGIVDCGVLKLIEMMFWFVCFGMIGRFSVMLGGRFSICVCLLLMLICNCVGVWVIFVGIVF